MWERNFSRRDAIKVFGLAPFVPHLRDRLASEIQPQFNADMLMYHEVSGPRFKNDMMQLLRGGSQPVSAETLIGALDGNVIIPSDMSTFHVTFDDGLTSQTSALQAVNEIQQETGVFIPITFFVMTKFDDIPITLEELPDETPSYNDGVHKYMTKGQLVELVRQGHNVQNHTINHPTNLSQLPEGARNAEIITADQRIDALWQLAGQQRQQKLFAYPYGRYNNGVIDTLISTGYQAAFTTKFDTKHTSDKRYILGRVRKS